MSDNSTALNPVIVHCGNSNGLVGGSDAGWPLSAMGPGHRYSCCYQVSLGDLILDQEMQVRISRTHRENMIAAPCNPCNVARRTLLLSETLRDELAKVRYIAGVNDFFNVPANDELVFS